MESPFSHLLATNYAPSKEEISQINDLLHDPVNQLGLLDAEILRLQKITEALTAKRTQLDDGILQHRALLAPMRRIPEELLQEIFIHLSSDPSQRSHERQARPPSPRASLQPMAEGFSVHTSPLVKHSHRYHG